jgi:hypothetical protein
MVPTLSENLCTLAYSTTNGGERDKVWNYLLMNDTAPWSWLINYTITAAVETSESYWLPKMYDLKILCVTCSRHFFDAKT